MSKENYDIVENNNESVLVKGNDVKVIDAEFVFVGPIVFDIGVLIANFIFSAIIHWDSNIGFSRWILSEISELFKSVNNVKIEKNFEFDLNNSIRDILGQAGIEVFRRILGIAHLEDFTSLSPKLKNEKELKALEVASDFILLPEKDYSTDIVFDIINNILSK